jgi:hypothetical protein
MRREHELRARESKVPRRIIQSKGEAAREFITSDV